LRSLVCRGAAAAPLQTVQKFYSRCKKSLHFFDLKNNALLKKTLTKQQDIKKLTTAWNLLSIYHQLEWVRHSVIPAR
jgi:hypothetical protein